MPIYDYLCEKCGHEFEREQRIVEDPIKRCPACKSLKAKRLISNTSFVLKGGGWYNDLYSSSSAGKKDSPSESSDSAAKSDSGDAKSDPVAAKTESKSGSSEPRSKDKAKSKKSAA